MKKTVYIDLMERVMAAYTDEHIRAYTKSVIKTELRSMGIQDLPQILGF